MKRKPNLNSFRKPCHNIIFFFSAILCLSYYFFLSSLHSYWVYHHYHFFFIFFNQFGQCVSDEAEVCDWSKWQPSQLIIRDNHISLSLNFPLNGTIITISLFHGGHVKIGKTQMKMININDVWIQFSCWHCSCWLTGTVPSFLILVTPVPILLWRGGGYTAQYLRIFHYYRYHRMPVCLICIPTWKQGYKIFSYWVV